MQELKLFLKQIMCAAMPCCCGTAPGPPYNVSEPLQIYDMLRQDWTPGSSSSSGAGGQASIFASSFDAFVDGVLAELPSLNLPVITGRCTQQAQESSNSRGSDFSMRCSIGRPEFLPCCVACPQAAQNDGGNGWAHLTEAVLHGHAVLRLVLPARSAATSRPEATIARCYQLISS